MIQQKRNDKFLLFLPLFLIELYLGMTLLLYQFGPIPWKTENKALFWTLIACYHVAFIVGYVLFANQVSNFKTISHFVLQDNGSFFAFFLDFFTDLHNCQFD